MVHPTQMHDQSLVVFDLDGTLYRTAPVTVAAIMDAATEHGQSLPSEAEVLAFMGRGIGDLVRSMFPGAEDPELEHIRLSVRRLEREGIRERATLFDGIPELLDQLDSWGLATAVCSNGSYEYINAVLQATGIQGRFAYLESGHADHSKSVAMSRITIESGLANIIMVGDTLQDRIAAEENDLPFIAAMFGYGAAALRDCEQQAHTVAQLGALLHCWQLQLFQM